MDRKLKIFSGRSNPALAERIANSLEHLHIEQIDHAHIDDIGEIHGDVTTHPKPF